VNRLGMDKDADGREISGLSGAGVLGAQRGEVLWKALCDLP